MNTEFMGKTGKFVARRFDDGGRFVPFMRVHKCAMVVSIAQMRKARNDQVLKAAAAEIKARRAFIKISQEELAHRADVHRSFIARLEVAKTQPSLAVLLLLAEALEVDASVLVAAITERLGRQRSTAVNL